MMMTIELLIALGLPLAYLMISTAVLSTRHQRLPRFLQQLLRIHALEQGIGHNRHPTQLRNPVAHLSDGMVRIHRPYRLDAAALGVAEEH